jgi:S1-C subfamily serine protease
MKKTISSFAFFLLLLNFLSAQSSGGTNIDRSLEHLSEKLERTAERIEAKAETTAEVWERRADRFAEQIENKWDKDWSVRLDGFGRNIAYSTCPEIAYLGIQTMEVSTEKAKKLGFENRYGSYVSKVMAKSTAATAGLQAFDYIYGVDEQRSSNNQGLTDMLEDFEAGDEITLHFVRKGQKMSAKVKLAETTDYEFDEAENERPFLGVSPSDDGNEEELDGVSVEVVEKSTAEEMGLKVGDVITAINGYPVLDWDDVSTAVQNTKPGDAIEVNFKRDEKELSGKGTIKSYEELYPNDGQGNWNLDVDWDQMGNVAIAQGDDWEQDEEQDENRAFIGIYTEMISKDKAKKLGYENPYGNFVSGVIPNSGADKAGLKPFDYIYGFDEYRVGEDQHLGNITKKFKPGEKATVHFVRSGKKSSVPLTFTKPFQAEKNEMDRCEDPFLGINQINEDDEDVDGVAISPVKGSTAMELGMREGDVITHINGYQMVDWQDISTAIGLVKPGETINVEFLRDGKAIKASKPIKSHAQTKNCADCDCGERESVVIATSPGNFKLKFNNEHLATTPTPRMNIDLAKVDLGNVSTDESNALSSKGIQLPAASTLAVETVRLSPNPSNGLFNLDFNLPTSGNTLVRIYNLTGRVLYEYDLGSFSGKFNDSVDISQNGAGSYFLEISQSGKIFTKKIALSRN